MLIKNGQLKIKTINGKIVAKPDLKTAAGNGVVRKYKVAEKGIRYRKIYKTKESRYMYLLQDIVEFAEQQLPLPIQRQKKKIDKTDALLSGSLVGAGSGIGVGALIANNLGREKSAKIKTKYGVIGGVAGGLALGGLAAYQNIRNQKKDNAKL